MNTNQENISKKIKEKDEAKIKFQEKLELLKQHYGIYFDIKYFENGSLDKIKFSNLEYKTTAKNISLIYDNKYGNFNYISYDYDSESAIKNLNDKKIINGLNREKKLKLVVAEITRLDNEYKRELENIDTKYLEENNVIMKELEVKKNSEES